MSWKKRRCPKKKRGPKKKKISKPRYVKKPYRYWVICCKNGRQCGNLKKARTIEEAMAKVNEHLTNPEDIIFEKTIKNQGALMPFIKEYLILERNPDNTKTDPSFRNEYGKLVVNKVTNKDWVIVNKFKCPVEETFWVYGYDKIHDRKTFKWVYDNLIVGKISDPYDYKRITIYGNKVVIQHDDDTMDIVLCKNDSDAIKFNNLLEKFVKEDKIKQVCFFGKLLGRSEGAINMMNKIVKYTGWTKEQVKRLSTRH